MATTKDAVVAIASLMAELDVPALLPAGQTAPHGWAITDTGVDVLGDGPRCPANTSSSPPGEPDKRGAIEANEPDDARREYPSACFKADGGAVKTTPQDSRGVAASYTWEQLHVDGDLLKAVRNDAIVFRAAAGSTDFKRIDAPAVGALGGPGLLESDGDGLLIVGQKSTISGNMDKTAATILRSGDGRTWTEGEAPQGFGYAHAVGRLGGSTVIVGQSDTGPTHVVRERRRRLDRDVAGLRDRSRVARHVEHGAGLCLGRPPRCGRRHQRDADPIAERGGITLTVERVHASDPQPPVRGGRSPTRPARNWPGATTCSIPRPAAHCAPTS